MSFDATLCQVYVSAAGGGLLTHQWPGGPGGLPTIVPIVNSFVPFVPTLPEIGTALYIGSITYQTHLVESAPSIFGIVRGYTIFLDA